MWIYRWAEELEEYKKTLKHRSGENMRHVDALSREMGVMIVQDNTLEANLTDSQNLDKNIVELRGKLEVGEDKLYEMIKRLDLQEV